MNSYFKRVVYVGKRQHMKIDKHNRTMIPTFTLNSVANIAKQKFENFTRM
jgi:hypothetical protein